MMIHQRTLYLYLRIRGLGLGLFQHIKLLGVDLSNSGISPIHIGQSSCLQLPEKRICFSIRWNYFHFLSDTIGITFTFCNVPFGFLIIFRLGYNLKIITCLRRSFAVAPAGINWRRSFSCSSVQRNFWNPRRFQRSVSWLHWPPLSNTNTSILEPCMYSSFIFTGHTLNPFFLEYLHRHTSTVACLDFLGMCALEKFFNCE